MSNAPSARKPRPGRAFVAGIAALPVVGAFWYLMDNALIMAAGGSIGPTFLGEENVPAEAWWLVPTQIVVAVSSVGAVLATARYFYRR